MKKYEYISIDLSPTYSLNKEKKMNELIKKLNELGKEGWIIISGFEVMKYAIFAREIDQSVQ